MLWDLTCESDRDLLNKYTSLFNKYTSGTGSTAIYPLIACSIHNTWRFLATGELQHNDIYIYVLGCEALQRTRNEQLWRLLTQCTLTHLEIDNRSLVAAAANLTQNPTITNRVQLLPATQGGPILFPLLPETLVQTGIGSGQQRPCVAFSMCNPPFYSDIEEVSRSADNKELDPHAVRQITLNRLLYNWALHVGD
jgi:23S rRNA A1618 N6-methylase RlmF